MTPTTATPREILDFWFDADHGEDVQAWMKQAMRWFRGGMDDAIVARFQPTLEAAARGDLDSWAETAEGRLALILVLDQFPRSIYRDDPRAYATDSKALAIALEGLDNGHYDALVDPWQKTFFAMPLGHAEGPELLDRLDRTIALADAIHDAAPEALKPIWDANRMQPRRHREVIARFGRHPHRNAVLGRPSTAEELAYLERGEFPHASPNAKMKAMMAQHQVSLP